MYLWETTQKYVHQIFLGQFLDDFRAKEALCQLKKSFTNSGNTCHNYKNDKIISNLPMI